MRMGNVAYQYLLRIMTAEIIFLTFKVVSCTNVCI